MSEKKSIISICKIVLVTFFLIINFNTPAQILDSLILFEPSLEDLLDLKVTTASKELESQKIAPATIYVITEKDIISNGYLELKDVLENVPGVTAINLDFFTFGGQRGFLGNFSQTLLLINGREVQNLIAGETFISHQFTTHNIKQIEIINGPGSALYGANAFVGVINIITKNDSKDYEKTEVLVELGTQKTNALSVVFGKTFGDLHISGSVRLYESDEWDFSDFVADTNNFSEGFSEIARGKIDSENRYLNQTRAIPLSLKLSYKGFYTGRESYFNKANKGIERVALDYNGLRDYRKFQMNYLGWNYNVNNNHHINIEYQHSKEWMWGVNFQFKDALWDSLIVENPDRSITDPLTQEEIHRYFMDVYSQENSIGSTRDKFNVIFKSSFLNGLKTIVGYTYDNFDILGIVHSYNDHFPYNDQRLPSSRSNKHSGLFQLKKPFFGQKLNITLGGRLDYHSIYGDVWIFRGGFVLNPFNETYIKGLLGQAFREPNIFELKGNEDLKPTKINTYEFSVFHSFNANLQGNLTFFKNDAVDFINPSTTFVFENSDEVKTVWGLESQLFFKYKKFSGDIRYAYTNPDEEVFASQTISALNVYQHRVNLGFNYDLLKFLRLNTRINYYPDMVAKHGNFSINETININSYTKVNLTVSVDGYEYHGVNLKLQATVKNLFGGKFYQPNVRRGGPKQFLQPGRQILAKLIFEF